MEAKLDKGESSFIYLYLWIALQSIGWYTKQQQQIDFVLRHIFFESQLRKVQ